MVNFRISKGGVVYVNEQAVGSIQQNRNQFGLTKGFSVYRYSLVDGTQKIADLPTRKEALVFSKEKWGN